MAWFEDLMMENWPKFEGLILSSEKVFPESIRSSAGDFIDSLSGGGVFKVIFEGSAYAGNAIAYAMGEQERAEFAPDLPADSRVLYIMNLVIEPQFQRRGLGSALFQEVLREAREKGFTHVMGHFRPNCVLDIARRMGAVEHGTFRNWEGTGEDYVLCHIPIAEPEQPKEAERHLPDLSQELQFLPAMPHHQSE